MPAGRIVNWNGWKQQGRRGNEAKTLKTKTDRFHHGEIGLEKGAGGGFSSVQVGCGGTQLAPAGLFRAGRGVMVGREVCCMVDTVVRRGRGATYGRGKVGGEALCVVERKMLRMKKSEMWSMVREGRMCCMVEDGEVWCVLKVCCIVREGTV